VIYYPAAQDGQGMAYLEGLIGESYTEFDGHWYAVSSAGQRAMQGLLDGHHDTAVDHSAQFTSLRDGQCNGM
jgi:hypothetical protein